jgi:four helix bundle protein
MTAEREKGSVICSHRDLIVWQRAAQLASASRKVCQRLPLEARYALADQILRAAVSIAGNIAEGRGRLSKADNVRHLAIARGSVEELKSHLDLASDMGYVPAEQTLAARQLADEVRRMLNSQIRRLGNRKLS